MKHMAYGLLLVALVSVSGIVPADAEERRTDPTTTPSTTSAPPPDTGSQTSDPTGTYGVPVPTSEGGTTGITQDAFFPMIVIPQTEFVVAPGGTAKVNYVAQCTSDGSDLNCSVQIYRIAEECTLHDSYTLQTVPGGAFKYLPAGHYVFLIGKGLSWAEASKLPTTKSYLVTITETGS